MELSPWFSFQLFYCLHIFLSPSSPSVPKIPVSPSSGAEYLLWLPLPSCSHFQGTTSSLTFATFLPASYHFMLATSICRCSLETQVTLAREEGRLTADLHLLTLSIKSNPTGSFPSSVEENFLWLPFLPSSHLHLITHSASYLITTH